MHATGSASAERLGRTLITALLVIAASATAVADGGAGRSGGLVPSPRKTREELIREWDLNSDGRIDQGEAEVAASRMRRERAELRLNSGIDPLTGLPRGEAGQAGLEQEEQSPDDADADADMVLEEEPLDADTRSEDDERPALPGTRVPRPRLPGAGKPTETRDLNAGRAPAGPVGAAAVDRLRRPLTGGARGGGIPARAGYGSGVPSGPLNAGRPIEPRTRVIAPAPTAARGGLAAPSRPGATGARPPAPAPPRPAPSREAYNPY